MLRLKTYPFCKQSDKMDCGPACLQMIATFYGNKISMQALRELCQINYHGVSIAGIEEAANQLGIKTLAAEIPFDALISKGPTPCIVYWSRNHFVVLWKVCKKYVYIGDPALRKTVRYHHKTFLLHWSHSPQEQKGIAVFLEPTLRFKAFGSNEQPTTSLRSIFQSIKLYKGTVIKVALSLLAASLGSLAVPFLTQAIVDKGIKYKDPSLLTLICLSQLLLFSTRLAIDHVRSRLLFRLGMKVSQEILGRFLSKLLKLKFSFFDARSTGDNIQRLSDNQRVEEFLTKHTVSALLSVISILVYGSVLSYYSWKVFLIFLTGSLAALLWNYSFKEKRRLFDQRKFKLFAANQQMQMELFSAMREIRLTGSEAEKSSKWSDLQVQLYGMKMESLKIDQCMQGVSLLINESKNIFTTYFTATLVLHGHLTLGAMLAITYICGTLNGPVVQLADFVRASQDTRFSLQRIAEVQFEQEEDGDHKKILKEGELLTAPIVLSNVSFKYGGASAPFILRNIDLVIPPGKITAIVGMSGSGKTTLIKLLLKFYQPGAGAIYVGNNDLEALQAKAWRRHCGIVMQESHIFSDTIAGNIWVGSLVKEHAAVVHAASLANLHDFVDTLPFGYDTIIGKDGINLSEGQKQRLLIARLIYRQPHFIFMDEATNSLDANNEKAIIHNLNTFFKGRTVVVVAHRLSTVSHADQIIVMESGRVIEQGDHKELSLKKGAYYNLVKNQLELGK